MLSELSNKLLKIAVVDDSALFRGAISSPLENEPGVEVVGKFRHGQEIVDFISKGNEVNLITLDMEMPVLDGMGALRLIREKNKKIIIICFSSLTQKGAAKTIEALTNGANDFVAKENAESINADLLPKIRAFRDKHCGISKYQQENLFKASKTSFNSNIPMSPRAIVIGSSTGGPEALKIVFSDLLPLNIPIFLVQHMPPIFTTQLAKALTSSSKIEVIEAENGMQAEAGKCYLAPGNFHMFLKWKDSKAYIFLNQDEKVCFVRPSVDILFKSAAEIYGERLLSIVLTGMGNDGREGARDIMNRGGSVYIQDEKSCVVWGMPGAIAEASIGARILELENIGSFINNSHIKKQTTSE